MRKQPALLIALIAAFAFGGLPAVTIAQDARQPDPAKAEPGKIERAKEEVKQGAREAGREVDRAAKTAGHEIKHAAKETEAGAKSGWHSFKRAAAESWRSVKGFFSRMFNS